MSYLKKTLAVFLMVCMLASMMPVGTAFAAADVPAAEADVGEPAMSEPAPDENAPADNAVTLADAQSEDTTPAAPVTDADATAAGANTTDADAGTTPTDNTDAGTTPPDDTNAGGTTTPCEHKGETKTDPAVAATCTTEGKTEEVKCAACDAHISGGEKIPALGHAWDHTDKAKAVCTREGCGAACTHKDGETSKFADGVCEGCGYKCEAHDWSKQDGVCALCAVTCTHTWNEGTCATCGKVCTHEWTEGTCGVCGTVCKHENEKTVDVEAKEATCTTDGNEKGTRYETCGAVKEGCKVIPAAHKWAEDGSGVCTVCSAACTHKDGETSKFADGVCSLCGYTCTHTQTMGDGTTSSLFVDGVCSACQFVCKHEHITDGKCDVCKSSALVKITNSAAAEETFYASLADAVSAAKDGDTITLLADLTLSQYVLFNQNISVVLDLNQHAVTSTNTGAPAFYIYQGSVTIKNGTISQENGKYSVISVGKTAKTLNIESTATVIGGATGVQVSAAGSTANLSGTIQAQSYGVTVFGNATVNISGKISVGRGAAVSGNATTPGSTINIKDGAELKSELTAIYHPQQGTMNISGGTITGGQTGVEVRAGVVNISGGTISGKTDSITVQPSNGGTTTLGAGLAVAQHTGNYAGKIAITISGGTITGCHAIHESNPQNNPAEKIDQVSISVTGGQFNGAIFSSDDKITFSGEAKDRPLNAEVTESGGKANVNSDFIHAGAENVVTTQLKDTVLPKKALEECASSADTIVTVDTAEAKVSLDAAALRTINGAVPATGSATVHVEMVETTADGKKYQVYVTDQDGNRIGSDDAGLGGSAAVVLKGITTKPVQVRHYDLIDGSDTYKFIEAPAFAYDETQGTVTVTINHFSYLVTSMSAMPVIDRDSLMLPAAEVGVAYDEQLTATGDAPIEWSCTGKLPDGLTLSKDGRLSGTVASTVASGNYTVTVTATNAAGSDTAELTITVGEFVVAAVYDTDADGNPIVTGNEPTFTSVQSAIDAATDGQVVMVFEDANEDVTVEGKYVVICGDVPGRLLRSITVKTDAQGYPGVVGVGNITANAVTIEQDCGAGLVDGNNIKNVINRNTIGNVDNPDPFVIIEGGHYGSLSPAAGGDYLVLPGTTEKTTFDTEVPMEYCREVLNEQGDIKQRYAWYNSRTKQYEIADFKFDITAVSNSGYHMPGSQKTLVFSTNLDYTLADRDRAASKITITTGNSSKPISNVYYDITADKDGKAQITLKASTLNKLSLGRYILRYDGPTGTDSMYFHISNTVRTGDTSNIGMWLGIMGGSVVVLCAVAAVLVIKSKKKNGGAKNEEELE